MQDLIPIVALALLPAAGTMIGGVIAECSRPPDWFVGTALHAAAGVAIGVVAIALIPRILVGGEVAVSALLLACGMLAAFLLARGFGGGRSEPQGKAAGLMVAATVAADLAGDGLMTGAGSAVASRLGLILAVSQILGNMPGGFAAIANLRQRELPRSRRLLLIGVIPLIAPLAAAVGFITLRGASEAIQAAALTLMAGFLLLATVEDVLPEGDRPRPPRRYSTAAFAAGFVGMFAFAST